MRKFYHHNILPRIYGPQNNRILRNIFRSQKQEIHTDVCDDADCDVDAARGVFKPRPGATRKHT